MLYFTVIEFLDELFALNNLNYFTIIEFLDELFKLTMMNLIR